jgi:hypothetical protein
LGHGAFTADEVLDEVDGSNIAEIVVRRLIDERKRPPVT